jgi:hypothetical protein
MIGNFKMRLLDKAKEVTKMSKRSHVDLSKLDKVPVGKPFSYKDVVEDDFPDEEHTEDGKVFKSEVENGLYGSVEAIKESDSHLIYEKK